MLKTDICVNWLEMSSLAYKCVFYRAENNTISEQLNFEGLEIQR